MGFLKEKYASYDLPQQFMAKGVYPYFRCIDSEQDTEVIMNGTAKTSTSSGAMRSIITKAPMIVMALERSCTKSLASDSLTVLTS